MSRRALVILAFGYALLVGAWLMSTQPFGAPDEAAHYLRALMITNGHPLGRHAPTTLLSVEGPVSVMGREWANQNSRTVRVPARLTPPGPICLDGQPDRRGSCVESTYVGTYPPLPYLLPAAALGVAGNVDTASWLTRAASALPVIAFLVLALLLAWDGSVWSILGLVAAITPMVLFTASVLNPSGVEIAACAAFLAALLRIARAPAGTPPWVWALAALSGAVAVLSWQLGPVFVVLDLVLFGLLVARDQLRDMARRCGRSLTVLSGVLVLALVLFLAYWAIAGGAPTTIALGRLGELHAGFDQVWPTVRESVGTFGKLTVPLPSPLRALWLVAVLALTVAALAVGDRRQRLLLLGTAALGVLFPTLFYAVIYRHTGFGLQGRYVLPVLMMVPMLAGEILRLHARAGRFALRRSILPAAIALIAILQLWAWWVNARASAGRPHAAWFLSAAAWSPPGGWWPWLVMAILGSCLLVTGALAAMPRRHAAR